MSKSESASDELMYGELRLTLLRQISRRAGFAVSQIDIGQAENRIVVRGFADSYYAWQLVHAACREVLANDPNLSLDCALTVTAADGYRR